MKLRPEQLAGALGRGLAPLYLVYGEEPLLAQEAADAIRAAARAAGVDTREVFAVEAGFDWNAFATAAASLSLFGGRRLLELRLPSGRPGDEGGRALRAYAADPPADTVLLVLAGKLDAATQKSAWFTALETAGVGVACLPVEARALPEWLARRAAARGMRLAPEALALLAERGEGNLLAAEQELEKLYVLYGREPIDAPTVLDVVGDSARYSIYDFADAALEGDAARVLRTLNGLRAEGEELPLALWALAREVRLLAQAAADAERGLPADASFARLKVWEKRKPLLRKALARIGVREARRLLAGCARVDRQLKGAEPGDAWDTLLALALRLAGRDLRLVRSA